MWFKFCFPEFEHFSCAYFSFIIFFYAISIQFFGLFLIGLFFYLFLSSNLSYIFWIQVFNQMYDLQCFLLWLVFLLIFWCLSKCKFFKFGVVQFINFKKSFTLLASYLRNCRLTYRKIHSNIFFSYEFSSFSSYHQVYNSFQVNLWWVKCLNSSFAYGASIISMPFVEKLLFPYWNASANALSSNSGLSI